MRPDTAIVPASADARVEEEQAAIDRARSLLSGEQRAFVASRLADSTTDGSIVSVPNAEVADLIAKVYAIREACRRDARLAEQRAMAAVYSAPVLVSQLPASVTPPFPVLLIRTTGRAARAYAEQVISQLHATYMTRSIAGYGQVRAVQVTTGPAAR